MIRLVESISQSTYQDHPFLLPPRVFKEFLVHSFTHAQEEEIYHIDPSRPLLPSSPFFTSTLLFIDPLIPTTSRTWSPILLIPRRPL